MHKKIIFLLILILVTIQSAHAAIYLDVWTDKYVYYLDEPITVYIYGSGFGFPGPTLQFPTSCQVDYIMDGTYDSFPGLCLYIVTYVTLPHTWEIEHDFSGYAPGVGSHSISAYMHPPYDMFCSSETNYFIIIPNPDINRDGRVDFRDVSICGKAWKSTPSDENWDSSCNLAPPNNIIDESDLKIIADNWLIELEY